MDKIYLSSPHMGGTELDYVHEAFDTNWIAPLGANVNGFEEDLQSYTGRKHAAVVTSGTAAIHLGLILCGVKPGDEVLCQSFTFAATANPIRFQGAEPVFIDSEPDTWNMDPDLLEKAILDRLNPISSSDESASSDESHGSVPLSSDEFPSSDEFHDPVPPSSNESHGSINRRMAGNETKGKMPKAIVVVHLYGMPAKMNRIMEIANKYKIPVIEDSAEALGSFIHARKCGSFGKLSVLSFNGNKIITTSGGGALLSNDQELIQKARFLATQARDDAPHYQHSELGYNYRMSNIVAGIGRGQMQVLDKRVEARRNNHQFYFENLGKTWIQSSDKKKHEMNLFTGSPTGIYFLPEPDGYRSNRWLTTILVNPEETGGVTREDIRLALEKENIECRPLWKPMHLQPYYENFLYYGNGVSDKLFEFGLCLPSGSNLSSRDKERVVAAIQNMLPESV